MPTKIKEDAELIALRLKINTICKDNWGAYQQIAKRAKCSREWVRIVLTGKAHSLSVLNAATEWIAERRDEVEGFKEKATQLINTLN